MGVVGLRWYVSSLLSLLLFFNMISFKSNHLDDVINLVIFIETHCPVPPLLLLQGSVAEENIDLGRSNNMDNVWCSLAFYQGLAFYLLKILC